MVSTEPAQTTQTGEQTDIDQSQSGAPAGGRAVRDFFSSDEIFARVAASAEEEFALPYRMLFL
ncbi:MAG: formate/nitrite transporter family protein, partial [Chloroflexi bacterium]|nr:formate/nitrite transporter family protein [Chloroflexota bacterium]